MKLILAYSILLCLCFEALGQPAGTPAPTPRDQQGFLPVEGDPATKPAKPSLPVPAKAEPPAATPTPGAYVLEDAVYVGGWDPKVINTWTVLRAGKPTRRSRFVVRAYDRARLCAALRSAGLKPIRFWNGLSFDYGAAGPGGSRLVILSRKPERARAGAASR